MAKMIFATKNRDESHRVLEYVRGDRVASGVDSDFPGTETFAALAGKHPRAECREDPNSALPYEVWDGTLRDV